MATLLDVELLLAQALEGAGLGLSTTGPAPSLYAGGFSAAAPDRMVAVRHSGGGGLDYLGGGRFTEADVQVLVRGLRERPTDTRTLAVACWQALHQRAVPGLVHVLAEGAGPVSMGPDETGRLRYVFTVVAAYV